MRKARVHLIFMILAITLGCTEDEEQNDGIIDQDEIDFHSGNRSGRMSLMVKPLMSPNGINYGGGRAGLTMNSRPIQTVTLIYILRMGTLLSRD